MRNLRVIVIAFIVIMAVVGLPVIIVLQHQNSLEEVDNEPKKVATSVKKEDADKGNIETEDSSKKGEDESESQLKDDEEDSIKNKEKTNKDSSNDKDKEKNNDKDVDEEDDLEGYEKISIAYLNSLCNLEFDDMMSYMPKAITDSNQNDFINSANYMNQIKKTIDSYEGLNISYSGKRGEYEKVDEEYVNLWSEFIDNYAGDNKYEYSEIYQVKVDLTMKVSYKGNSDSESTVLYLYAFNENNEWKMFSSTYTFEQFIDSNTTYITK